MRQLAGTLGRLASREVGLLDFPRATEVKGRFEHFRMLDETGRLDLARFRLIEDGFKKEAVSTVMETLKGLGVRKPDAA